MREGGVLRGRAQLVSSNGTSAVARRYGDVRDHRPRIVHVRVRHEKVKPVRQAAFVGRSEARQSLFDDIIIITRSMFLLTYKSYFALAPSRRAAFALC